MPSAATVAVPAFGLMSTQRTCSRWPDLVIMSPSSPGPKVWLLIIAKTRGGVPKMDFKVRSANDGPLIWLLGSPAKRSEEHTSELQSLRHLVCRLLLENTK